uniref:Uncharacterized protein n=1 Tax=Oryza nivara TaxID=4536 RepID=A0A0E0HBY9_ORYNI
MAVAWPGVARGGWPWQAAAVVRYDGGRRLWRTATRLKDREAPRDYVVAYPAFFLGGGGPRWRGDELPRRSAAAMVAAALRSRGHKRIYGAPMSLMARGIERKLTEATARWCGLSGGVLFGRRGARRWRGRSR